MCVCSLFLVFAGRGPRLSSSLSSSGRLLAFLVRFESRSVMCSYSVPLSFHFLSILFHKSVRISCTFNRRKLVVI